jgi:dCTP deaminase
MILSDYSIERLAQQHGMITPFERDQIRQFDDGTRIISKGLSSYGYDVTLAPDVLVFTAQFGKIADPKRLDMDCTMATKTFHEDGACYVILPSNSYLLGHTTESFAIPNNVLAICVGKSTYARAGIQINVTPIEPGFRGQVVIEVSNATSLPVRIYLNEGIAQFLFLRGDTACRTNYAARDGKYQNQRGITHGKV